MGQREIIELLEKNPNKWYNSQMIKEELGTNRCNITKSMGQLVHFKAVNFKENKKDKKRFKYIIKYKRQEQ